MTLGRRLIIKDCLVSMPVLIVLEVVVEFMLELIIDPVPGAGDVVLVLLLPYYLVVALILSSLFASISVHLQKKLKEIEKYKIEHKTSLIMTRLATFLCWLVPLAGQYYFYCMPFCIIDENDHAIIKT